MVELLAFDIEVKPFGNSAHVILPKEFTGERVDIVRRGLAPHFALEFRKAGEDASVLTLVVQSVSALMGEDGCSGIVVRGAYGPARDRLVKPLRDLEARTRRERLSLLVLKDGHTPVVRIERARVAIGTAKLWSTGFSFVVLAEDEDVLDAEALSPPLPERAWTRQIRA